MKKVTVIAILAVFLIFAKFSFSQNVGINTPTPNSSAILDITSTNKGVLLPRVVLLSAEDAATIPNPAIGLMVYHIGGSTSNLIPGFYYFNGARWVEIISNDRIYGFAAYGEMFEAKPFNGGTTYPLTIGIWSEWTSAEQGLCENVTPEINGGTDYLIANEAGAYQIAMAVSYQGDNSMQVSIQAFILRGADVLDLPKIQIHNKLAANGDLVSGAASGVIDLMAGDKVFVMFKCENATKNIQVEILNLSMAKISI